MGSNTVTANSIRLGNSSVSTANQYFLWNLFIAVLHLPQYIANNTVIRNILIKRGWDIN
jgi:hypothetical protein